MGVLHLTDARQDGQESTVQYSQVFQAPLLSASCHLVVTIHHFCALTQQPPRVRADRQVGLKFCKLDIIL